MRVPEALAWWRSRPGGAAWLDRLPALVDACAERWSLTIGNALPGGNVALVLEATRADESAVVLKLSFSGEESEHEADALSHWCGEGAVRLLERDDQRRAVLLERAIPGTPLWSVADDAEATTVGAAVLRRLHGRAPAQDHGFRLLEEAATRWQTTIPADWEATGRVYSRSLVETAVDACRSLAAAESRDVVLHQDFHGGNVLRAGDEWLVIDPKPLVGDPAFDAASLLRDRRWELRTLDDVQRIRRRLDVLGDVTGLDRERMRLWGIVHALAWGVSGRKLEPDMVWCAELLASL